MYCSEANINDLEADDVSNSAQYNNLCGLHIFQIIILYIYLKKKLIKDGYVGEGYPVSGTTAILGSGREKSNTDTSPNI